DLAARGADAGQVRGRDKARLAEDAGDGRVRALAGRTAGAVGHRNEIGGKRRQPVDRLPEIALHLLRLGRKKLERDLWRFEHALPIGRGNGKLGHDARNNLGKCGQQAYRAETKISQTQTTKQPIRLGKLPTIGSNLIFSALFLSDWASVIKSRSGINV